MLPSISGLDICLRLRSTDVQVPIIMLIAKDEVADRVTGLNAGVDNYVTKPSSMEEVLARVKHICTELNQMNLISYNVKTLF